MCSPQALLKSPQMMKKVKKHHSDVNLFIFVLFCYLLFLVCILKSVLCQILVEPCFLCIITQKIKRDCCPLQTWFDFSFSFT